MSFRPNTVGQLLRKQAKRTIHGKEMFEAPVPLPCAVVQLADKVEPSSVRADSSASRGSADQEVLQAKILVSPTTRISKGDVISIMSRLVEVASVHQRNDIFGNLHHLEIAGDIKGDM